MYPEAQLRILATTDLHMHLLGDDAATDRPAAGHGLAGLCDVIASRRNAAGKACLLLDNGDFLQGTGLADAVAGTADHPMATAFNTLAYDAVTLGNHEFDYGLTALSGFLGQLACPAVSANLTTETGALPWQRFVILERWLPCSDGTARLLRIGVTGVAPRSVTKADGLRVLPFDEAIEDCLPMIRQAGADLVVALCHAGFGRSPHHQGESATVLAQRGGVDALVMGHTHGLFPDPAGVDGAGACHARGTLHGTPAVMPGHHGSALGEIDLSLSHSDSGWTVTGHSSRVHVLDTHHLPRSAARRKIETLALPLYARTRQDLSHVIGRTGQPLHNRFGGVRPDPVSQLLADVMRKAVTTATGSLCRIAAVSCLQPVAGGEASDAITLPAGALTKRDAARVFPYADRLCTVRQTGRQIREWLEKSASGYAYLCGAAETASLIDADCAGHHCDGMFGLTYGIDLGAPPRRDCSTFTQTHHKGRILDLRLDGHALGDDATYLVATTDYRARGGGGYAPVPKRDVVWTSTLPLREILIAAIGQGAAHALTLQEVWRFHGPAGSALRIAGPAPDSADMPADWQRITDAGRACDYLIRF